MAEKLSDDAKESEDLAKQESDKAECRQIAKITLPSKSMMTKNWRTRSTGTASKFARRAESFNAMLIKMLKESVGGSPQNRRQPSKMRPPPIPQRRPGERWS